MEGREYGIRANSISPGLMESRELVRNRHRRRRRRRHEGVVTREELRLENAETTKGKAAT
jgi:NAD(P)-dependent dehydrogenase (short-subunit alcohol dehydrogenase family)